MASIENELFQLLSDKGNYEKYIDYVPVDVLSMVGAQFLKQIESYWKMYPSNAYIDWDTFSVWMGHVSATGDPNLKAMQQLAEVNKEVDPACVVGKDILNRIIEKDVAEQINACVEECLDAGGSINDAHIQDLLEDLRKFQAADELTKVDETAVSTDIEDVLKNSHVTDDGLPFSLDKLRRSAGPLRPGDTVYVVKRPETGGTTFVLDQTAYMIKNTEDTSALIFSNEEDGNRLMLRLYQAALNWQAKQIMADPEEAKRLYQRYYGSLDRIKIYHGSNITRKDVERLVSAHNPDLVVFNMLNKIKGFNQRNTSDVDVLTNQAKWMRELANGYGAATMTVWQAGGSAHGKAWLEQDDMYASKTGVPAEADLIIGIGQIIDDSGASGVDENARFLHLSKNKLIGDSKTEDKLRHGYFDSVFIDPEHGRFTER